MDFPVEATFHLNMFQDEREVLKILSSHSFEMKELGGGQVRVKGYFSKLKDAKDKLDQLLSSQTKMSPNPPSPVPTASSGAVPKNYSRRDKTPRASPSSPTSSSSPAPGSSHSRPAAASSSLERRGSLRGEVSVVIDADVFRYADQFKKKDISTILTSHNVEIKQQECGDMYNITLMGRNSNTAMCKLQSLMDDLSKSLRTQEVPLQDMNRDGRALLGKIRQNGKIEGSVLVRQMPDRLLLIGSSSESYELKQRLLGRTVQMKGRTGRSSARSSRGRSSSAPPIGRESTEAAADPNPSPGGAAGYSPSKYRDDKREDAAAGRGAAAAHSRGRSQSVSRENPREKESKASSQKSPRKLKPILQSIPADMKKAFKKLKIKKK